MVSSFQCFSDALMNFPTKRLGQLLRRFTDVYFIKFNFRGSYSGFKCNASINSNLCEGEITLILLKAHVNNFFLCIFPFKKSSKKI